MLKEFLWNTFEKTGNVEAYVFFKEMEERNLALSTSQVVQEEVAISS